MLRCEKCKHYNCEADKYPCAVCDSNVNDLFEEKKQTNGVGYCTDKRIKKWLQSEAEE